jgi:hypothetical protein
MSNEAAPKGPGIKIAAITSEVAPFIYCDGVATFGFNNGVVQLELAANAIVPEGTGTRIDVLITAHLRCSAGAAMQLRDSITKALETPAAQESLQAIPAGTKPN